jgi:A/G-specific adenine glycosylase
VTTRPDPGAKNLSRGFCAWFNASARELPWRGKGRTPYRVWVSEIMLQQTQVSAVVPYFNRWMEKFPTCLALRAPTNRRRSSSGGLGYYSRARNLLKAARTMMERHGGKIPRGREDLEALPGVGRYTAGAVLSLAYGCGGRWWTETSGACWHGSFVWKTRLRRGSGRSPKHWCRRKTQEPTTKP